MLLGENDPKDTRIILHITRWTLGRKGGLLTDGDFLGSDGGQKTHCNIRHASGPRLRGRFPSSTLNWEITLAGYCIHTPAEDKGKQNLFQRVKPSKQLHPTWIALFGHRLTPYSRKTKNGLPQKRPLILPFLTSYPRGSRRTICQLVKSHRIANEQYADYR